MQEQPAARYGLRRFQHRLCPDVVVLQRLLDVGVEVDGRCAVDDDAHLHIRARVSRVT